MKTNTVSLIDLILLLGNPELSEKYINYLCTFEDKHRYRHEEIESISKLVDILKLNDIDCNGFIYGYSVSQLNKEFDLLKITEYKCINIEIKSHTVDKDKIKKQLLQNAHYLKMLGKELYLTTFDAESKILYHLNGNGDLVECDSTEVAKQLVGLQNQDIELDKIFSPSNILVSPLNEPEKFFKGKYLLTENQSTIKEKLISNLCGGDDHKFYAINGAPGTGKTLLLFDIAFDLAKRDKNVLMIHSGIMCDGHVVLGSKMANLNIVGAKALRYRELKGYDCVFVDESQRIYASIFEKIQRWVEKAKKKCVFAYDESQIMSKSEKATNTSSLIANICSGEQMSHLTNKIRTNKEIALFITCLRDISKYNNYEFPNVNIKFEPNKSEAVKLAKQLEADGFQYISYTPSFYNDCLEYQASKLNTHRVIGQEFDGVTMILSDRFFYENNKLCSYQHPNSNFIYTQLLYQGLTRARTKLFIIIQTEDLLAQIIKMFKQKK